jgi:probable F420-dependent oxidoreductase
MRVGVTLPHMGDAAGAESVDAAAQRAEALGYDTVWVADRLLYPLAPRTPYPGTPDGSLPELYRRVLDPLVTLTFVAAHTRRLRVGTAVLDLPFYTPVPLARQLTTLDVLSGGRLRVGCGLGWSQDEFEAVGASLQERGARADEFLAALQAIWTTDPVEFHGKYYQIPPSIIGPKPIQRPHPPLYLAAYVAPAIRRAARLANGWMPMGIPLDALAALIPQFREMARAAGRDPASLEVIVGGFLELAPESLPAERRPLFVGSADQVREDLQRLGALGIEEVLFGLIPDPAHGGLDGYLATLEQARALVPG